MRIVVPHVGDLDGRVVAALHVTGRLADVELHDVSGSDRSYFELLRDLWTAGDTFCVVEHDIVVHPEALDELEGCSHGWCGFPHELGSAGLQYGLGCVRFDASLIARHPSAVIRAGVLSDPAHPKRHWCRMDAWLQGTILPALGETKCRHERPVTHLGSGCSHGCISV